MHDDEGAAEPLGVVVEAERGSWPFALLHGEALVSWSARAMGEAGVQLLDHTTSWEEVRDAGQPLVWHDALCPAVPPGFIAACVRRAVDDGVVVAGVLPVTDTVKVVVTQNEGPVVGATLDRERLHRLVSPLVLPAPVVGMLDDWPSTDLRVALAALRERADVVFLDAPASARRVRHLDDLRALEALTAR